MSYLISSFIILFIMFGCTYAVIKPLKVIIYMITLTVFYYAILGALYWYYVNGAYFLGVYWGEDIFYGSFLFLIFSLILVISIVVSSLFLNRTLVIDSSSIGPHAIPTSFWLVASVSVLSCLYVYLDRNARGGLFLVAYQFSDLLIPVILLLVAVGRRKFAMSLVAFFVLYCVFVGFRYKLVILFIPLFLYILAVSDTKRKFLWGMLLPVLVLSLFSVMTLFRVKFSGIDISAASDVSVERLLYGFLADTNILFGLLAIDDYIISSDLFVGVTPFVDSFKDLVPRFLLPDKDVGGYLIYVLEGLIAKEGLHSGTTYPFFGEYLMMGGYLGAVAGCIVLGGVISFFGRLVLSSGNRDAIILGAGLLAVLFGYYYVSRGYMPQFFKALVFILLPYLYYSKAIWSKDV